MQSGLGAASTGRSIRGGFGAAGDCRGGGDFCSKELGEIGCAAFPVWTIPVPCRGRAKCLGQPIRWRGRLGGRSEVYLGRGIK